MDSRCCSAGPAVAGQAKNRVSGRETRTGSHQTVAQTLNHSSKFHINNVIIHPIQINNRLQNKQADVPNLSYPLSPPLSLSLSPRLSALI